ncbi:MAG: glycerate-2-kinase family protein, partial [Burkholderiaceae bacterium]|nr:glycerate-2-kinase family protein [Burkholderiaceae bacterium]
MNSQQLLKDMFDAAIASAQPERCIPHFMPKPSEIGRGRFIVIGAGKASAAMARTVEQNWLGTIEGLVVTRYGYAVPCQSIEIIEASHPVPDEAGIVAAQRIFDLVSDLTEDDTVLCLISGGGSSLLPMPLPGLTLEDKQS